jgi:rSAM/selenodomain-associated transferase 1
LGKVKTRLARELGAAQALRIYEALLGHTREQALAVHARRLLFYSDGIAWQDDWPAGQFHKYAQEGDELGPRMAHAFQIALQQARAAIIVGSDIAQLSAAIIAKAFEDLERHDCVIGPALDGGYYLLGMKALVPALFEGIAWSRPTVCAETIAAMERLGMSYALAPTLSDIDYAEDWARYGWPLG